MIQLVGGNHVGETLANQFSPSQTRMTVSQQPALLEAEMLHQTL